MSSLAQSYPQLVAALVDFYGQPTPAVESGSPFAAVIVAGMSRGPAMPNRDRLITALDGLGLLNPDALEGLGPDELRDTLSDVGIRLADSSASLVVRLARWYATTFPVGTEPAEAGISTEELRDQLVQFNGVGPAGAQAILLALGHAAYPVDRGTYRILVRHGWTDCPEDPEELSQLLAGLAHEDCAEITRLAGWLSTVGRQFCGPGVPKCQGCPLESLLPDRGPLEPEH
jgi:endonuclease-3 related protein